MQRDLVRRDPSSKKKKVVVIALFNVASSDVILTPLNHPMHMCSSSTSKCSKLPRVACMVLVTLLPSPRCQHLPVWVWGSLVAQSQVLRQPPWAACPLHLPLRQWRPLVCCRPPWAYRHKGRGPRWEVCWTMVGGSRYYDWLYSVCGMCNKCGRKILWTVCAHKICLRCFKELMHVCVHMCMKTWWMGCCATWLLLSTTMVVQYVHDWPPHHAHSLLLHPHESHILWCVLHSLWWLIWLSLYLVLLQACRGLQWQPILTASCSWGLRSHSCRSSKWCPTASPRRVSCVGSHSVSVGVGYDVLQC